MTRMGLLSMVALGGLTLAAACGSQPRGVVEAPNASGGAGHGQCLDRGVACNANGDCCSQWCVSGTCSTKQP